MLSERTEILVPLMYIICYVLGWIGPNADFLAGFKLTTWQYAAIDNFEKFLSNLVLFFLIDFSSFVVNGVLLWITLRINILKILKEIQMEFWLIMAMQEASIFIEV